MNHGLKALLIAASTIITCMIISLGFFMAREAKQIGNHVVDELHEYRITIEEQDYTMYDGATVYGNDVINLMKRLFSGKNNDVWIAVEKEDCTNIYMGKEDIKNAQEYGTSQYIAPVEEYTGYVIRNENKVIVGVTFTEKRDTEEDNK